MVVSEAVVQLYVLIPIHPTTQVSLFRDGTRKETVITVTTKSWDSQLLRVEYYSCQSVPLLFCSPAEHSSKCWNHTLGKSDAKNYPTKAAAAAAATTRTSKAKCKTKKTNVNVTSRSIHATSHGQFIDLCLVQPFPYLRIA